MSLLFFPQSHLVSCGTPGGDGGRPDLCFLLYASALRENLVHITFHFPITVTKARFDFYSLHHHVLEYHQINMPYAWEA